MRRTLLLLLAIGMLSSQALPSAAPNPWAILPGQGIGTLRLGMTIVEAIIALGAPTITAGSPGVNTVLLWFDAQKAKKTHQGGLFAVGAPSGVIRDGALLRTDVVINVGVVLDERYVTPGGLHTGVAEGDVIAALGNTSRVIDPGVALLEGKVDPNIHILKYAGVEFGIRDSHVIQITVTP